MGCELVAPRPAERAGTMAPLHCLAAVHDHGVPDDEGGSETSATTTLAPSRAKASAAARPIPLAAPVKKTIFLRNDLLS